MTETYYPVVGGGETQARSLANVLVADGLEVLVVTRRSDAMFKRVEQIDTITVYRLPPSGSQHLKKWGLLLTSIPALIRLRGQYDVIFVSGFRVVGVSAVIISRLFDKVCVLKADSIGEMSGNFFAAGLTKMGIRSTSMIFGFFLGIRNWILRRADAFVAISTVIADELIDHGVAKQKVHLIPNSVDTTRFQPVSAAEKNRLRHRLDLPLDQVIVIFTGRLVSYKGLPLLLQVWQEVRNNHRNSFLLLVGSGSMDIDNCEEELHSTVSSKGLQDSVLFTGSVSNVNEYLQASDIFVFPSENEAFGISVIEAMACGMPVVSTDSGGLNDIITDHENGLVVEAGNFDQLHHAMEKLMADEQLANRLSHKARQDVKEYFSMERVTQSYIDLFDQLSNSGL